MALLAIWKVLEEITIEFQKKSIAVPQSIMGNLRSAKVLINIVNANEKSQTEVAPKIAEYLGSVEAYLVSEAPKNFSSKKIETWLKQLEQASHATVTQEDKANLRFTSGAPRSEKWVKVKPLPNMSIEKLETFAVESKLSFRTEEDGQLLVYGNPDALKEFIKKVTIQTSRQH